MVMAKARLFDNSVGGKVVFSKPIESVSLPVKVRFNKNRSQGARIESLPLKRLVELSKFGFRNWSVVVHGDKVWLVLDAIR